MPHPDTVLICVKCCRRLGDDGKTLRKAIRKALKSGHWGEVTLQKANCFSLCPKRGQVLASDPPAGPRRLLVAEPGAVVADALDYLLGAPRAPPRNHPE